MNLQTQSTSIPYVLPLYDLTRTDVGCVGAKAANLGELARAGFPVPDGFAITTQAFDSFISANALNETQSPEKVAKADLPPEVQDALRSASSKLNGAPLAVRSSSVAEDLEGASFAGQYETILDVRGYEALADAVRQCWASAFSARVAAYKSNKGQMKDASMAVLVQMLVNADAAGVAFTANPVNGHRDETVVSAVRGPGERLVSGDASPDEWIVNGKEATRTTAPEDAIDEKQARAIAEMARRAKAHFGSPQDVEWAIADGRLFMLQTRPITTLGEPAIEPIPMKVEIPEGYWESDAEHISKPLSPMARSILLPSQTRAMEKMCTKSFFIHYETRQPAPLLELQLFQRGNFSAANGAIAFSNMSMYVILLALPILLSEREGWSSVQTGLLLAVTSAAMALFSPVGGRLADRLGRRSPSVSGLLLITFSMIPLIWIGLGVTTPILSICLALAGAGLGLSAPVLQTSALESADPNHTGMASGIAPTSRYMGSILGSGLLSGLLAPTQNDAHFRAVFLMVALAALIAACMSLRIHNVLSQRLNVVVKKA